MWLSLLLQAAEDIEVDTRVLEVSDLAPRVFIHLLLKIFQNAR